MADASIVAQAHEWVDRLNAGRGLSGNWRLQVIQKRYRKNAVGECGHELPTRIRRFASGCPWALVDEAIRYLVSLAPYSQARGTGVLYNGLLLEQEYRPTTTQWVRDEQTSVDEANPKNGTYTLIQDLIENSECEDSESADTGSSCSEHTETTWHWDEGAPGDLSDYTTGCEQGVTFAITQVNRKDDGTFDWALVKRTAYTQHSGPVVVECNSQGKVTAETWDNLYGSDGSYSSHACDGTQTPVSLPGCSDSTPGVRYQVQVTENPDCTFKAVVTKREAYSYSTEWTEGTACRSVSVQHLFNEVSQPSVPVPAVGETVQAQVVRNEDDSYNAQIRVTSAPEEVELHWTDGSACKPREVSRYSNMRSRPALPAIGEGESLSASLKKNDDCTWDADFTLTKPSSEATFEWDQGSPCRPEHVKSYQNSKTKPSVPALESGKVISATIRRNDDCTYDGQVSVRSAPEGEDFEWEQGSECRKEHVKRYIRSKTVPVVPAPSGGTTVSATISKNEDDCTYDAQVTVRDPGDSTPVTYTTGTACTVVTEKSVRNAAAPLDIPSPKPGESVTANITRNDDCTYDSRYALTRVSDREYDWTSTENCDSSSVTSVYENKEDPFVPDPPGTGEVQAVAVSFDERTCLYTTQVRKTVFNEYDSGLITWVSLETNRGSWQKVEHGLRIFSHVKTLPLPPDSLHAWNFSFTRNEDCTFSGSMSYGDCVEWGGSGYEGGIREDDDDPSKPDEGRVVVYGGVAYVMEMISFIGEGNEGTEAYWRNNCVKVFPWGRASFAHRTYCKRIHVMAKPNEKITPFVPASGE